MRLIKWIQRIVKGIRDRLMWILGGLFGPPFAALKRLLLAWRDKFDSIVAKLLEWWANIWRKPPSDEKEDLGKPSIACLVFAAFILAAVLYSWPSWEHLSTFWFVVANIGVWLVSLLWLRRISYQDSEHRFSNVLREAGFRSGLIWWERFGAVACVVLLFLSRRSPHLLSLAIAVTLAFLRLLITKYELRELGRLAAPPLQPSPAVTELERDDYVDREFRWTLHTTMLADDNEMTVSIHVPTYQRLRQTNPKTGWEGDDPRFDRWIVDGATSEVDRAAYALAALSRERRYSTFVEISNALAFVQAIPYSFDKDTTGHEDYWRYPIETMYDNTGDCEDTTILAAAVLRRLGHRVGTMLMPEHAALAVEAPPGTPGEFIMYQGRPMYYCETTDKGWKIGEVPRGLRNQPLALHVVLD